MTVRNTEHGANQMTITPPTTKYEINLEDGSYRITVHTFDTEGFEGTTGTSHEVPIDFDNRAEAVEFAETLI